MPGFARLQDALEASEHIAFTAEGMLRWLNDSREDEDDVVASVPFTAQSFADKTAELFEARVKWWKGEG